MARTQAPRLASRSASPRESRDSRRQGERPSSRSSSVSSSRHRCGGGSRASSVSSQRGRSPSPAPSDRERGDNRDNREMAHRQAQIQQRPASASTTTRSRPSSSTGGGSLSGNLPVRGWLSEKPEFQVNSTSRLRPQSAGSVSRLQPGTTDRYTALSRPRQNFNRGAAPPASIAAPSPPPASESLSWNAPAWDPSHNYDNYSYSQAPRSQARQTENGETADSGQC